MMRSGDGVDGAVVWTGVDLDRADCEVDFVGGTGGRAVSAARTNPAFSTMTAVRKIRARMGAPLVTPIRISSPADSPGNGPQQCDDSGRATRSFDGTLGMSVCAFAKSTHIIIVRGNASPKQQLRIVRTDRRPPRDKPRPRPTNVGVDANPATLPSKGSRTGQCRRGCELFEEAQP